MSHHAPADKDGLPPTPSLKHALFGAALALVLCSIVAEARSHHGLEFLAGLLALTSAVYLGSALSDGRRQVFVVEGLASLLVFATALAGLWVSTVWLAVGYFAHGLWDLVHHPHRLGAPVRMPWFPPACLAFDWIVGGFVLLSDWGPSLDLLSAIP